MTGGVEHADNLPDIIILAGGKGTRIGHLLGELPKPMLEVAGKPFLEWQVLYYRQQGFRRFIISVGFRREAIINHFGDGSGWNVNITYCIEDEPLGTGGAIAVAGRDVKTDDALVINGDSIAAHDTREFHARHCEYEYPITIAAVMVDDIERYGAIDPGSANTVRRFTEKGSGHQPGLINAGLYMIEKQALLSMPTHPCSFETEVLPNRLADGIGLFRTNEAFIDIGTPESLAQADAFMRNFAASIEMSE